MRESLSLERFSDKVNIKIVGEGGLTSVISKI